MLDEILYSGKIAESSCLCILGCLQLRRGRDGFDENVTINFVVQSFHEVSRVRGVSATSEFTNYSLVTCSQNGRHKSRATGDVYGHIGASDSLLATQVLYFCDESWAI